jgi:hypothetical protein
VEEKLKSIPMDARLQSLREQASDRERGRAEALERAYRQVCRLELFCDQLSQLR